VHLVEKLCTFFLLDIKEEEEEEEDLFVFKKTFMASKRARGTAGDQQWVRGT
jgi:hypothetical protein